MGFFLSNFATAFSLVKMSLEVKEKSGPGAALFSAQKATEVRIQMLGDNFAGIACSLATTIVVALLELHQFGNAYG